MAEYKTPGVYVEEISTFPASVVRVETAVPVFIGYTEKAPLELKNKAIKVKSLVEYELLYGGEPTTDGRTVNVTVDANGKPTSVALILKFYLYQCLRHFYANGGGDAYIMTVGDYATAPGTDALRKADLIAALAPSGPLEDADEPTLILTPDAFAFASATDLGDVQKQVLAHCAKLQDRFGILDVKMSPLVSNAALNFRTAIGSQNLKYGAAYFPELKTNLGPNGEISVAQITAPLGLLTMAGMQAATGDPSIISYNKAKVDIGILPTRAAVNLYKSAYEAQAPVTSKATLANRVEKVKDIAVALYNLHTLTFQHADITALVAATIGSPAASLVKPHAQALVNIDVGFGLLVNPPNYVAQTLLGKIAVGDFDDLGFDYGLVAPVAVPAELGGPAMPATLTAVFAVASPIVEAAFQALWGYLDQIVKLAEYLSSDTLLFTTSKAMSDIRDAIRSTGYTLPPCGAMAGVYATVDASRGVWKAPANVSLNAVDSVLKMTEDDTNDLNVPGDGQGKSINAIRFFRGQGNLVYGARTLAGNDNEWRYVPVRRLFIMVEESVRKATEPFVFEPNSASTWLMVKGMIENFLNGIWKDGGLAGAVPEDAYFVKVGLGQTMTAQDILEGKMIIEIGMAAVRPAEFVILKFMHKMQES